MIINICNISEIEIKLRKFMVQYYWHIFIFVFVDDIMTYERLIVFKEIFLTKNNNH
jgi:hypothetical protein